MAVLAKIKDTEYLYITSVIRAKEPRLLSKAQLDRMIEAKSDAEALRVLEECGFDDLSDANALEMEKILSDYFQEILAELAKYVPDPHLVDIFRLKYDYHNAKVLLKAQAAGTDGTRLLSKAGRYAPEILSECFIQGNQGPLPQIFADSMREAKDALASTKDAQQADFLLDRAYFAEFSAMANDSDSDFVRGYCALVIDTANLRTAVRGARMDMDAHILDSALINGGSVAVSSLAAVKTGDGPGALYSAGPLAAAASLASEPLGDGGLTLFEKYCDNALLAYLQSAKMVSFGEAPVAAFISAVEAEITAVRIVINSRRLNLPSETIRERLRDSYV